MGLIQLKQRHIAQPQYAAPIDWANPLASGLASANVFDNAGSIVDRVTGVRYPVTNGTYRIDKPGRVTSFAGTGYVNTGKQSIGGANLFADSTSQWSVVIYARLESAGGTGSFAGKCSADAASRTFHLYSDGTASHFPGIRLRGSLTVPAWGWSTAEWHQYTVTWDGSTAKLYGDYDKEITLAVGAAAQESENIVFGARTGGAGGLLAGRIAYGYLYNRAISRAESIALYENPWQIFKAQPRRLWVASSVSPGGDTVGSSPGLAAVSGVGASVAASTGSASGLTTVSGVGNSATAGASTGSSAGSSTVNGVSASIAGSVGSASGESVVTGRTPIVVIETEFSGGFPWVDHDDRKKKQRAKLGIIKEEKPKVVDISKHLKNSNLASKSAVAVDTRIVQQEALNAELRRLVQVEAQLELEREEEIILRMLMEL